MEHIEFPKMLYFKGDPTNQKIVNSEAEEAAAGDDWYDAPIDPASAAAEASAAPAPVVPAKKK